MVIVWGDQCVLRRAKARVVHTFIGSRTSKPGGVYTGDAALSASRGAAAAA